MKCPPAKSLALLAVTALSLASTPGCDDEEVPPDGVAKVGAVVIEKSEFDKWFKVVAVSPFLPGQAFVAAPPNPPSFSNCVAAKRGSVVSKRQDKLSDDQLKKQCEREYAELKLETMHTVIENEWIQQAAAAQDITISAESIDRAFAERKAGGFPSEQAYARFLKDSGMTEDDLRFLIKVEQLQERVEQRIAEKESRVSDEDVLAYYKRNKASFTEPERRAFTYVLAQSEARAARARRAVEERETWEAVVQRYSVDPENSRAEVVHESEPEGDHAALERAVLKTSKGDLGGPVKTALGWYVFEVTKVTPVVQQPLAVVKATIAERLRKQRQETALEQFEQDYRSKTVCADEFKAPQCSNGPSVGAASPTSSSSDAAPSPRQLG
jgi:foldase protein PrsA